MIDKEEFYSSHLSPVTKYIAVFCRHFADKLFVTQWYRVVLLDTKHPPTPDEK